MASAFVYFISLVGIFIGSYVYLYRKGDYGAVIYDVMKCYTMASFYFKKISGFLGLGQQPSTERVEKEKEKEKEDNVLPEYDPVLSRSTKYIYKLDMSHFFILLGRQQKSPAMNYFEEILDEQLKEGVFHFFLFHHPRFPGEALFIVSFRNNASSATAVTTTTTHPEFINLVFNEFDEVCEYFFKKSSTKLVPRIYPFVSSFGSFGDEDSAMHFTIPSSFLYRVMEEDETSATTEDDFKDLLHHLKIGFFFQLEHHADDQLLHKNPSFSIIDENYEYHTFG